MSNPETERERERAGEREIFSHSLTRPLTHSHWIALLIALATFALYLRTLAPDVVDADGGEFQFAAWNFGFVHPTGYPLFLILGGLFQHLVPIGNPAYRLSVFNALIAAGAIGILFLAINELTRARGAALIAAFAFALTRAFWYDANAPEVYALNALFIALLFYLAARWQTNPHAKTFAAFCFILGLALTHHRAILLWLPGFGLFFLLSARQQPITNHQLPIPNYVLRFTFYFLLPLLLYLYLPLRAPAAPYATLAFAPGRDLVLFDNSPGGIVDYILGRAFQSELRWDAQSLARLNAFPQLLFDQFGVIGIAFGACGFFATLWRTDWARTALMLAGFITTILFASAYHIGDIVHYYLPTFLMWSIWISIAIQLLTRRLTTYHLPFTVILAIAILAPQLTANFSVADRSREIQPREQWTKILAEPIPRNAILVSNDRDEMMPLWYMQYVENTRRDLLGVFPLITPENTTIARITDRALATNRPVFFIKAMPGIEIKYAIQPFDANLDRVQPAEMRPPFASSASIAERVRVIGFDARRAQNELRVVIYLQPRARLAANYTTTVQLHGARGGKIAQGNDHQVGGEFYPTVLWEPDEILRDEHIIDLPPDLKPGIYRLFFGMYRQPDFDPLGALEEIGGIDLP